MDVFEAVKTRKSVRVYDSKPVPTETLTRRGVKNSQEDNLQGSWLNRQLLLLAVVIRKPRQNGAWSMFRLPWNILC